jgi:hypothetical protein
MFRRLNEKEEAILKRYQRRGQVHGALNAAKRRVRYDRHDNFVVAVVKVDSGVYTGVAKFNPADPTFNPEVGQSLAFSRAVRRN